MSTPKSQSASLNWRVQANALTESCGWICVLSKLPNKGSPGKRSCTRFAAQVAEKPTSSKKITSCLPTIRE